VAGSQSFMAIGASSEAHDVGHVEGDVSTDAI
jgi:hypothetical protein